MVSSEAYKQGRHKPRTVEARFTKLRRMSEANRAFWESRDALKAAYWQGKAEAYKHGETTAAMMRV